MVTPHQLEPRVVSSFQGAFGALERYLLDVVAGLKRKDGEILGTDAYNTTKLEQTIRTLELQFKRFGYDKAIDTSVKSLKALNADVLEQTERLAIDAGERSGFREFSKSSEFAVKSLIQGTEKSLLQASEKTAVEIGELLRRSLFGGVEYIDLLQQIESRINLNRSQTLTLARTSLHSFNSQLRVKHSKEVGIDWFALSGPRDHILRPWCSHWVGMRGTFKDFGKTRSKWGRAKHPFPISAFRGGWNCRHSWLPLFGSMVERYPIGPRYPNVYRVDYPQIDPKSELAAQKKGGLKATKTPKTISIPAQTRAAPAPKAPSVYQAKIDKDIAAIKKEYKEYSKQISMFSDKQRAEAVKKLQKSGANIQEMQAELRRLQEELKKKNRRKS